MKRNASNSVCTRATRRKLRSTHQNQTEINQRILQSQHLAKSAQFMQIVRKQQCRRLNHQLMEFHRRNFVNKDEESNMFKEQWQNKKTVEESQDLEIITYQSPLQIALAAITMFSFAFTIWLGNVQFFFGYNKQSFLPSLVYLFPMAIFVIDFIKTGQLRQILAVRSVKIIIFKLLKPFLCILYLILKMVSVTISQEVWWLILELPCLYILLSRASQFYKSFRVMSLSKKYQYHFKAFDLIFSLMMVAHVIAIILFHVAQKGYEVNWMTGLGIEGQNALIKYIYSFYFGCTTILTVGYGDITPKNHIQIAVVCFIQIFGIAIFAYLISQIGYNLGTLRKDRQIVEKDLSILEKCRSYYKISPQLIVKARSNLLNNKEAVNRLKPQQQKMLIMKLGEPLRQEIMSNNSLSVLKSSIFFLCRWSKQLQRTLSQCLVSALYTPGEQLFQPLGNQRIYIIRLGKIDFYRKQRGNKQEAQKMIKSLKVDLNREVSDNSFGYTAVIGSKPTVLQVISRDFTSAYYIDKEKFFKCVNETPIDFEYYHEIKNKIEQSRLPEAFEVPALNSRRFHFNPPRSCVIKRGNKTIRFLRNQRNPYERLEKNWNKKKQMIKSRLLSQKEVAQVREAFLNSLEEITLHEQEDRKSRPSIQMSLDQKILGNTVIQVGQVLAEVGTIKCLTANESNKFQQQGKEYLNYYPFQNMETVLERYDRNIPFAPNKRLIRVASRFTETTVYQNTKSF